MKIQWVRTTKVDKKKAQQNKSKEETAKGNESPKKSANNDQSLASGVRDDT